MEMEPTLKDDAVEDAIVDDDSGDEEDEQEQKKGGSRLGRKKIKIEKIEDSKNRQVTFNKRKVGLLKKAIELSVLCGCEVSVLIFHSDKMFEYSSKSPLETFKRYSEFEGSYEALDNSDLNNLRPGKSSSIRIARKRRNHELSESLARFQVDPYSSGSFQRTLNHAESSETPEELRLKKARLDHPEALNPSAVISDQWRMSASPQMYTHHPPAYYAYPPHPVKSEDIRSSPQQHQAIPLTYGMPHPLYHHYPYPPPGYPTVVYSSSVPQEPVTHNLSMPHYNPPPPTTAASTASSTPPIHDRTIEPPKEEDTSQTKKE